MDRCDNDDDTNNLVSINQGTHPILRRHYSTIGIGDVFVVSSGLVTQQQPSPDVSVETPHFVDASGIGPHNNHISCPRHQRWLLPNTYVNSPYWKDYCCTCHIYTNIDRASRNATTTGTTEKKLTNDSNGTTVQTILGDEIIGQLKYLPKDFIVREIASIKRDSNNHVIADLSLSSNNNNNNKATIQTNIVPKIPLSSDVSSNETSIATSDQVSRDSVPNESQNRNKKTNTNTLFATNAIDYDQDPMIQLQTVLSQHLYGLDLDFINNNNDSNKQNMVDTVLIALQQLVDTSYDIMNYIRQQKCDNTSSLAKYSTSDTTFDDDTMKTLLFELQQFQSKSMEHDQILVSERIVSFVLSDKRPEQHKYEKTMIHQWIRNAFPMLIAEKYTNLIIPSTTIKRTTTENINSNPDSENNVYHVHIRIDTTFFGLISYLYEPTMDLPLLYQYAKYGYEYAVHQSKKAYKQQTSKDTIPSSSSSWGFNNGIRYTTMDSCPILRLQPDLPRNERRPIHHIIDRQSKSLLGTETINQYPLLDILSNNSDTNLSSHATTTAIRVSWTKMAKRLASKKRFRESSNNGDSNNTENPQTMKKGCHNKYMLCVVRKRQREHLGMINTLSAILKCSSSDIGFAGIKDLQSISYQFGTIPDTVANRISSNYETLQQRGIEIVPIQPVDYQLNKGDLIGNHFEIILRNVRRIQLEFDKQHNRLLRETFIPVDETHIHNMVHRISTFGFINFYGEQRVGDPGNEDDVGVRAFDIGRAMIHQNYEKAIDLLLSGRRIIHGVELNDATIDEFRRIWKTTNGDPIATAKALPSSRNSVLRERTVLKGLIRYGKDKAIEAFRCLPRNERIFFMNAYQSYVWNMMATERIRRYGNKVVIGDLILIDGCTNKATIVNESNIVSSSIHDIVLPMPGYDVIYPSNDIGQLYHNFLLQDQVSIYEKDSVSDDCKVRGSYRRLLSNVTELTYEIRSSEHAVSTAQHGTIASTACHNDNNHSSNNENGIDQNNNIDISFSFDLSKGSYATMMLREMMLKTVARDSIEYTIKP